MTQFEIDALYGHLQSFVENQRTPRNPHMKLGSDLECEQGIDFLICPLYDWECYFHGPFVDRLRQDFGKNADVYDEPEPGGTIRRKIQVPIMIAADSPRHRSHRNHGAHSSHTRSADPSPIVKPSREITMFYFFSDIVLLLLLWHRITSGSHGF